MLIKSGLCTYNLSGYNKIKFILKKKIKNISIYNRRNEFYKNDIIKIIFIRKKNTIIKYIYNKKWII